MSTIILRIILIAIVLFGAFNWLGSFLISGGLYNEYIKENNIELPPGWIDAIAIDKQDRIYCATSYGRVQVYSSTGKHLKGTRVSTKGVFEFKTGENNNLYVKTSHAYYKVVYTSEGELYTEKIVDKKRLEKIDKFKSNVIDSGGNRYFAENGFFPTIYKEITFRYPPTNKESITIPIEIISVPFRLFIFQAPFPAAHLIIFPTIVLIVINRRKRSEKRRKEEEAKERREEEFEA
ncbi:MAG: hypothetical protein GY754_41510 [bacterium]|nr:hypothetical protein [bacterium]